MRLIGSSLATLGTYYIYAFYSRFESWAVSSILTPMTPNRLLLILAVLALITLGAWYVMKGNTAVVDEGTACTEDAMQCPDGTTVGRTGPDCEFVCPTPEAVGEFWGTVLGTVLLGPTCPVEMYPPDPKCADKPYAARLALTTADGARVIQEFNADAEGKFRIEVPPGDYAIRSAGGVTLPYCQTEPFNVSVNGFADVAVSCDSGIR